MLDRRAVQRVQDVGGPVLVGKMIDLLLTHGPERVEKAQRGGAVGDFQAVGEAVHSLKSSAGNLGATDLQNLCLRIEELAADGQGEEIPALLAELGAEWDRVRTALEAERKGLVP